MSSQEEPIHLVSVNTTPLVARALLATVLEVVNAVRRECYKLTFVDQDVKKDYKLIHVANSTTIEGIETLLHSLTVEPQLLICSSQWTPEQQDEVQRIARKTVAGIKTAAIPAGLNATKGGEAVIEWLKEMVYTVGLPRRV